MHNFHMVFGQRIDLGRRLRWSYRILHLKFNERTRYRRCFGLLAIVRRFTVAFLWRLLCWYKILEMFLWKICCGSRRQRVTQVNYLQWVVYLYWAHRFHQARSLCGKPCTFPVSLTFSLEGSVNTRNMIECTRLLSSLPEFDFKAQLEQSHSSRALQYASIPVPFLQVEASKSAPTRSACSKRTWGCSWFSMTHFPADF